MSVINILTSSIVLLTPIAHDTIKVLHSWHLQECIAHRMNRTCIQLWLSYLFILLLPFYELYVHVPEVFSMCNNIERPQLRWAPWNWIDSAWVQKIRKRSTFYGLGLGFNITVLWLYICVLRVFSMCNNDERPQLRWGAWNWIDSRWVQKIPKRNTFCGLSHWFSRCRLRALRLRARGFLDLE